MLDNYVNPLYDVDTLNKKHICKQDFKEWGVVMGISKKELVLNAMDRKEVERVPAGFWFHFLDDEIHADAYTHPELEKKVLDGEIRFIEEAQPDFVKIMTDGFFSYPNPAVQTARTAAAPGRSSLLYAAGRLREGDYAEVRHGGRDVLQHLLRGYDDQVYAAGDARGG